MPITETSDLPPKTRIVATTDLPGVPEGTGGRLGRGVGLALRRYRVAFDNGTDLTSVTHFDLVKEDEWDAFVEAREAAEAEADSEPEPAEQGDAEAGGDDAGDGAPVDDRLAALLAKSKAAKEKKQAEAAA
ncbi:MAG: hypothetical protein AAGK32_13780 [Actinomycetota bacterium]